MRYYVFRRGYNGANNSARAGGPETVRVAEVEADSEDQAINLATEAGVTVYNGQGIWAKPADEVDAKEKKQKQEINRRVKLF